MNIHDFRQKFTKWYYRKGYRMTYRPNDVELVFTCPLWLRPMVFIFFSPCAYYRECDYTI